MSGGPPVVSLSFRRKLPRRLHMNLTLLVTSDIDQDGLSFGTERDALSWNAVEMVPRIAELLAARGLPATWFVRADNQLDEVYGSAAYLFERFDALWSELRAAGHAIAWHPHIYRRAGGTYVVETDGARCAEQLRRVHAALPRPFTAVRVGEAFHSNESMRALDELGLRIDSTAIPGRKRDDGVRRFDWEPTPNEPYHPSRADYRVAGDDALRILEVPMTSMTIEAPYDSAPLRRYINLAYRSDILAAAFARYLETLDRERDHVIVTIVHPEEALPNANPLYGEGLAEIARNLDAVLAEIERHGTIAATTMDAL